MTVATDDSTFPSLFAHSLRKDWGVGILAAETDGKRRYLFEDGEERTFAPGFYQMLHRVERPTDQQQAAHTRLRGVLAKRRNKDAAGGKGPGEDFFDQLVRLHQVYAVGFSDPNWAAQVRGEGASTSTPSHRQRFIDLAREQLSASAIDSMLSAKQFSRVWDELVGILKQTNLVPAAQLKLKFVGAEQERTLAAAVRELLHGSTPYNQRFDRYLSAFAAAFNQPAKWELATAPAAIVSPREHICVELTTFRKQLKLLGTRRAIATQPSSADYTLLLANAQLIAKKLGEQGEAPRDLLDIRDFIVLTLKPPSKAAAAPRPRAKAAARAPSEADDDIADDDQSE